MLIGHPIGVILPDLLILCVICTIIHPVGYLAFSWCLKMVRKNGTSQGYRLKLQ
jgi:hypothetical protein